MFCKISSKKSAAKKAPRLFAAGLGAICHKPV
jgi:hypothetical protein